MPSEIKAQQLQGAVRISIPASVANDLGRLQKGLGVLAEALGHPMCCSGVDFSFITERQLLFDAELNIAPSIKRNVGGDFALEPTREVTVTLPAKASHDLGTLQDTIARVVDRLGCQACCSGFDISFLQERNFVLDQDLNIHGFSSL